MVRLDPANGKGWYHLGLLCRKENDRPEAIRAFREVVRLKPELAEVWHHLGLLLTEDDEREAARDAFREAVRLKPDYLHAWCGLGMTCAALGDEGELALVEQQLELLDPGVAARFRESYAQAAESAVASAAATPAAGRRRARSKRGTAANPASRFEAWLKSLPVPPPSRTPLTRGARDVSSFLVMLVPSAVRPEARVRRSPCARRGAAV